MDGNNGKHGSSGIDAFHNSHGSHDSHPSDRLLPPRGDYQTLLSFQKAEVVYDLTFRFAHKFLSKGDRTVDQMNYLIDQQLRRLEKDFLEQGGLRERMTRARLQYRNGKHGTNKSYDDHASPPRKSGGQP